MPNVLLELPLPVLLALIALVLGMLVLAHVLTGLRAPAEVSEPEPGEPRLRLVASSRGFEEDEAA